MKKLFIAAAILLLGVNLNAQVGMPRELTCTEEAFTFSASLGTGWKFITPKMGPVETIENNPYIILSLSLKTKNEMPLPLLLHGILPDAHDISQQSDGQLAYFDKLKLSHELNHRMTLNYFGRPVTYNLINPDFLLNRDSYPAVTLFHVGVGSDNFSQIAILQ